MDLFPENQWKLPLGLTISGHLLTFILMVMPTGFFFPQPELLEVQTINLFTAEEVRQLQPKREAPPPKIEPEVKRSEPPPKDVTSIAVDQSERAAAPVKVVSLRPRKLKKKLTPPVDSSNQQDEIRLKALERIQALVNKRKEDQAVKDEILRLRDSLRTARASRSLSDQRCTQVSPQERHATD